MRPRQHLRDLATRIALVRGSPIETFGAADLLHRDAGGAWLRILEADQTVYLHPRTTRPAGPAIEVGSDTLPDVVLEVDSKILTCHGSHHVSISNDTEGLYVNIMLLDVS